VHETDRALDKRLLRQIREDIDEFFDVTMCISLIPVTEIKRIQDSDGEIEEEINAQLD